ncbi:MAG: serine hydrolase domain-containing protein [Bacteroidales bacterium]
MKKIFKVLIGISLVLALIILLMPGYLRTALIYQTPDIDDYRIFHNRVIEAVDPQPWSYHQAFGELSIPERFTDSFFKFEPVAFLLIQNGQLLFEEYFDGYHASSLSGSFSMAKSIIALLIGAAIDDGYIQSVHQPVSDFLPDFAISGHNVTLHHLLTMTSGLDWDEEYAAAFSITTKAYYGRNLSALLQPLGVITPPGEEFYYSSGTTQLLAFVLEAATGVSVSEYTTRRLWKPLGAQEDALWSLDRKDGKEKAYCCFNSNARDFARMGQLVLNQGYWKGEKIISPEYIQKLITPVYGVKDRKGNPVDYYGYQTWILHHRNMQIPYFRGILGQYVFMLPQQDAVVVRLGHKRSDYRIQDIPSDVFLYVDMALEMLNQLPVADETD